MPCATVITVTIHSISQNQWLPMKGNQKHWLLSLQKRRGVITHLCSICLMPIAFSHAVRLKSCEVSLRCLESLQTVSLLGALSVATGWLLTPSVRSPLKRVQRKLRDTKCNVIKFMSSFLSEHCFDEGCGKLMCVHYFLVGGGVVLFAGYAVYDEMLSHVRISKAHILKRKGSMWTVFHDKETFSIRLQLSDTVINIKL